MEILNGIAVKRDQAYNLTVLASDFVVLVLSETVLSETVLSETVLVLDGCLN
jgi:hypothetical protein